MQPDPLLEDLVEAQPGPGPHGPGQLLELEAPLLRSDQVGVRGLRLGAGDQVAERGQVVAGDPKGGTGVEDVLPVPQVEHLVPGRLPGGDTEHDALRQFGTGVLAGVEHHLVSRRGRSARGFSLVGVPGLPGAGPDQPVVRLADQDPPGRPVQVEGVRPGARRVPAAGGDLLLAGQCLEHPCVGGQPDRVRCHLPVPGQGPHGGAQVLGHGCLDLRLVRPAVVRPPGDPCGGGPRDGGTVVGRGRRVVGDGPAGERTGGGHDKGLSGATGDVMAARASSAGLPAHRDPRERVVPFITKESVATTTPSSTVTP